VASCGGLTAFKETLSMIELRGKVTLSTAVEVVADLNTSAWVGIETSLQPGQELTVRTEGPDYRTTHFNIPGTKFKMLDRKTIAIEL
jgi:hypothetical protein